MQYCHEKKRTNKSCRCPPALEGRHRLKLSSTEITSISDFRTKMKFFCTKIKKILYLNKKNHYKTKIFRTKMKNFLPIIIIINKQTDDIIALQVKQTNTAKKFKQNIYKQMIKQTIKQFNKQTWCHCYNHCCWMGVI